MHYGLPDTMISDRGPQFASHVFKGITTSLQIKHKMSTAFHPQTDGQMECYNAELEAYLQIFCAYEPNSWNKMLPTDNLLQTCDLFVTFSSRSLCFSVYPLFTFSLLSLYLCLFTLSSAPDFILFTCYLPFITCIRHFTC